MARGSFLQSEEDSQDGFSGSEDGGSSRSSCRKCICCLVCTGAVIGAIAGLVLLVLESTQARKDLTVVSPTPSPTPSPTSGFVIVDTGYGRIQLHTPAPTMNQIGVVGLFLDASPTPGASGGAPRRRGIGSGTKATPTSLPTSLPRQDADLRHLDSLFETSRAEYPAAPVPKLPTLYCFSVMLPFGHEPVLMRAQYERGFSIFGCDGHDVFSNESFEIAPTTVDGEVTNTFPGSMAVQFNTWTWKIFNVKLALNSDVFVRAWTEVFKLGRWKSYDWTIKVDPDTVFFPTRLRELLAARPLLPSQAVPVLPDSCGNCKMPRFQNQTCASHVTFLQSQGLTCPESLTRVAAPRDCDCLCATTACNKPSSVYLRNCAVNEYTPDEPYPFHALHGPLEVLSRDAAADLEKGLGSCAEEFENTFGQWGEDWFLEHCLLRLGVNPLDNFASLKDGDCATNAWPCDSPHAAFQPFKDLDGYLQCHDNAEKRGQWPPKDPQFAEHKRWSPSTGMWMTYDENDDLTLWK